MLACCPLSSRVCQRESERERSRLCEGTCLLERKKKLLFCSLRHRQTCFCNTGTSIQPNKDLSYRQSFNSLKELILLFSSSGYLFFLEHNLKEELFFHTLSFFLPFCHPLVFGLLVSLSGTLVIIVIKVPRAMQPTVPSALDPSHLAN